MDDDEAELQVDHSDDDQVKIKKDQDPLSNSKKFVSSDFDEIIKYK